MTVRLLACRQCGKSFKTWPRLRLRTRYALQELRG